jgi:hypothetical protein
MTSTEDLELAFTPLTNPDTTKLNYPFEFIDIYDPTIFIRGIPTESTVCDADDFPNNIAEYYWIREGENDGDAWELLCKLDNNCYVFYSANCDYTGFDCQGGMRAYISKDKNTLFYMGMSEEERTRCLEDKRAE